MKRICLALAATAMALACCPKEQAPQKKDMCVQLYSARSILNHDNYGDLLKEIAAMGYTAVEAASYDDEEGLIYGDTPEVFKEKVEAAGKRQPVKEEEAPAPISLFEGEQKACINYNKARDYYIDENYYKIYGEVETTGTVVYEGGIKTMVEISEREWYRIVCMYRKGQGKLYKRPF